MENNINFIFKSLNKKKLAIFLILEIILDIIYYIVPFGFTLFLTLPFTLKKALIVLLIFMVSKSIRVIGNYLLSIYADRKSVV